MAGASGQYRAPEAERKTMYPNCDFADLPEKSANALAVEMLDLDGAELVDIGCGPGNLTCYLAGLGARAHGIDPHEERIAAAKALAKEKGVSVDFRIGVGEDLPFEDGALDIVVFSNSLHHVPVDTIAAALAESRRVLRPDGMLYVTEPVPRGSQFEVNQMVNDETDVRTAAYERLTELYGDGFELVTEVFVGRPNRYRDFEDFRRVNLERNPQRAELFVQHGEEMARRFEALKRPEGDTFVLDGALRANLLRRTG
jgi:ubiquinone/menaquinone biosynthesis C-methylase UbiE